MLNYLPWSLCVRKCSLNHLMHKWVLIHDDFWFLYTSDCGVKPSPNLYFFLTSASFRIGGRNWPAALQHAITVIFSLFFFRCWNMNFINPFSIITVSGLLFTGKPLSSMLDTFPGVSQKLFSVAAFSRVWRKLSNSVLVNSLRAS